MELKGQRRLSIDRSAAWSALNDPAILKASIPGCESIEMTGENAYAVVVAAALGPVRARFRGKLLVEDVVAPERYTLRFEGEGGAAGFAKGSAQVALAVSDGGTLLAYTASAQVGGRIAQVGNRLIDAAALKLADDFFAAFERASGGSGAAPAAAAAPVKKYGRFQYAMIAAILAALVASIWHALHQ
jgi:carbon monoxide dehydrogenase subunit G